MRRLRESARDQDCMVRLPGVCNNRKDTVVLAHKNGSGWGRKNPDLIGAFCCFECHDIVDGRRPSDFTPDELALWFYEGIFRTQEWWIKENYIEFK